MTTQQNSCERLGYENDLERAAVRQRRINTDNSRHRYDVLVLINGVPAVQFELKTLGTNPRRTIEQIVENQPANSHRRFSRKGVSDDASR